jgi:hypothetical protein
MLVLMRVDGCRSVVRKGEKVLGFMFLTSFVKDAYRAEHLAIAEKMAESVGNSSDDKGSSGSGASGAGGRKESVRKMGGVREGSRGKGVGGAAAGGETTSQALSRVWEEYQEKVPYDRIGFALYDEGAGSVTAHWAKSKSEHVQIGKGYSLPLERTTLAQLLPVGTR